MTRRPATRPPRSRCFLAETSKSMKNDRILRRERDLTRKTGFNFHIPLSGRPSGGDACKRRGAMLSAPLVAAEASRPRRGGRVVGAPHSKCGIGASLSGVQIPPLSAKLIS